VSSTFSMPWIESAPAVLVLGHEARALHEHAARAARRVEHAALERLEDLDHQADDRGRRVELAAHLTLGHRELGEEVLVDLAERVAFEVHRDRRERLQQLLQQARVERLVGLRQHARELRVVALDRAHRVVDRLARASSPCVRLRGTRAGREPRLRREEEHTRRVVAAGGSSTREPRRPVAPFSSSVAARRELRVGEAKEDQPEDGLGVLRRGEPAVGAQLIGGGPEALLQRGGRGVLRSRGDPAHVHRRYIDVPAGPEQRRRDFAARSAGIASRDAGRFPMMMGTSPRRDDRFTTQG
jgi:hypothetical protein